MSEINNGLIIVGVGVFYFTVIDPEAGTAYLTRFLDLGRMYLNNARVALNGGEMNGQSTKGQPPPKSHFTTGDPPPANDGTVHNPPTPVYS